MDIIGVLIENLIGYDFLIFVLAVVNGWVFYKLWIPTEKLYLHFNTIIGNSNRSKEAEENLKANTAEVSTLLDKESLLRYREKMLRRYSRYSNITSIFPLMGMLGTVISLLPMVSTIGSDVSGSFFTALTSTFWGIVFAIVFKILDSIIAYKIEDIEKHMDHILKSSLRKPQATEEN